MRNNRGETIRKILIVGAGPAGSSLAIRLATAGFEVMLADKDSFPRHKLCGEFISPESFEYFSELGILDEMTEAGGETIKETRFFSTSGKHVSISSNFFDQDGRGALGLSRYRMDLILMERARCAGVSIFEGIKAVELLRAGGEIRGVVFRGPTGDQTALEADLTIDATGRSTVLSKIHRRESGVVSRSSGQKFVGFKAHFRDASIDRSVCEIYSFRGGYAGLNFVEDGKANHCFLVRAEIVKELKGDADEIVRRLMHKNPAARLALANATREMDWLAVSFESFGAKSLAPAPGLLSVGDASAFIDPFTGSGILMALEGARILARAVVDERLSRGGLVEHYASDHRKTFRRRLRICSVMRHTVFSPILSRSVIAVLGSSRLLQKYVSTATRPPKTVEKANT